MPQGTLKKAGRQIKSSTVETNKEVFEIAVPHEAGHAVVANELRIPVRNIAFRLRRQLRHRLRLLVAAGRPRVEGSHGRK